MNEDEKKTMKMLVSTINIEINRICDTHSTSEFASMCGHAKRNLGTLLKMIYDVRFTLESEEQT